MDTKKGNIHKNHRQRLKSKVQKHSLECLEYHEILELFLTYTIPRKDTNPIAHNLIERFGSFANVIDANYFDLKKVEGVGPESAMFINMLSSFIEIYNKSKLEGKVEFLNSTGASVTFFRNHYSVKDKEFMVLACLSRNNRVVKTFTYSGFDDTEVSFDLKNIINNINDDGVRRVVVFHTHPNGRAVPSLEDVIATQKLINVCMVHGIEFEDHIILNESEHFSFKKREILDKMKQRCFDLFSPMSNSFLELLKLCKDDEN